MKILNSISNCLHEYNDDMYIKSRIYTRFVFDLDSGANPIYPFCLLRMPYAAESQ